MVKLGDYDCIGFDLDNTIIQYKLSNLYPLVYRCFAKHLVEQRGYDQCLLDDEFDNHKDFCLRGLILDTENGNILKIGEDGYILRASHGTREMNREDIKKCYGEAEVWSKYTTICKEGFVHSDYMAFENYFNLPVVVLAARVVDLIDKKSGKQEKYNFWPDIQSAFMPVFKPGNFAAKEGTYFPTVCENPEKYIKCCSDEVVNWIRSLRDHGLKTFLLTNSFIDYTEFLLDHAMGGDWRGIFDIVVCRAGKPAFFSAVKESSPKPFFELDGHKEVCEVAHPESGKYYSQGNHQEFMMCLKNISGKEHPKVLYFGDSLKCDLYPSAAYAKWDVVLLLEEMEVEGFETSSHTDNQELPIEEGKEDVLLSEQWGSLFTDTHDCRHSTAEDHKNDTKHKGGQELNTFWGNLIEKHCTIAIPRLDFIAGLPRDHNFQTFGSDSWGFFPGTPKSVC